MKKHIIFLLTIFLFGFSTLGQQNTSYREGNLISPVVNADRTVTFSVVAPKASQVEVWGDWEENGGHYVLSKGADGVWSCTTNPLKSEMYMYRMVIDGVANIDPLNPFVRRDVGNMFSILHVGGGVGDYFMVREVPHGTVSTVWYPSHETGTERRMTVYLPPLYNKQSCRRYPVLYLLHGSGGDECAWNDLGCVARMMDNLIAEGKAEPMIIVMPNGTISKPATSGETADNMNFRPVMTNMLPDYKNGRYELSFDEIVNYTDKHFRTRRCKYQRAIAGLSMGGMHTLYIGLNHPNLFQYYGLFSAGLNMDMDKATKAAYADVDNKLLNLKKKGYKLFWIACGTDDFLYENNQAFLARMDRLEFPYVYHESTRGHLWINWREYMLEFVPKLFKK